MILAAPLEASPDRPAAAAKPPASATRALAAKLGEGAEGVTVERWIETFSDEREIAALEQAIESGNPFPLQSVYEYRARLDREDAEFGDYVEDLLCQKAVRPEVQNHGIAWLRSKMKIEQFRQQEREAAEVIANFALAKYKEDPGLEDFVLAGPGIQVRIRIFKIRLAPGFSTIAA